MSADDPTVNSLILDQIKTLGETLSARIDANAAETNRRFDELDSKADRIEVQTTRTNGRVTALERARTHTQGMIHAYAWLGPTLSACLGAGLVVIAQHLA